MTKDEHIEVLMTSLHLMNKEIEKLKQEVFDTEKAKEDQWRWRQSDREEFKESASRFVKLLLEASVPVPRTAAALKDCLKRMVIRNNGITEDNDGFIVDLTDYNRVFIERNNAVPGN